MKRIFIFLPVCTSFLLLAVSCRKSPVTPVEPLPVPHAGKLAKLAYGDGSYDSVFYTPEGLITKIKKQATFPLLRTEWYVFTYNADKKVSRISQDNGEYYNYTHLGEELVAVAHYVAGSKNDFRLYDYLDGKLVAVEEYYRLPAGGPGYEFTAQRNFTYYPGGNLKQEISSSFDPQTRVPKKDFTVEYLDYDGNLNPSEPLGRFLYLPLLQLSKNNPQKMTTKDEAGGQLTEFSFQYTYNALFKPVARKLSYTSGGQQVNETVTYHYY